MKVLFISAANSVHTVRWVNALVERKQEVILVSLPNHREEANKINEKAKVLYLPVAGAAYRITCNNGNQRTLINP